MSDEWLCGLCEELIEEGEAVVRVAADAAIGDGEGGYESLVDREVMVFAIFHSQCVVDTMGDERYWDVPYLLEAQQILAEAPLCECCRKAITPEPEAVKFRVFDGGVK